MPEASQLAAREEYDAKAATLKVLRGVFRKDVESQLHDIGSELAFLFDVECSTKRDGKSALLEIKANNLQLQIRVDFSDESDQNYDEAIRKPPAGRWIDTVDVRLNEEGGKPRDLLFLKFIAYEGTFAKRPLSWQLDYMAAHYKARIGKAILFAKRGLNLTADQRRGYPAGTAPDGIMSELTVLLSERGLARKPEALRSTSKKVRDDGPGYNGDPAFG